MDALEEEEQRLKGRLGSLIMLEMTEKVSLTGRGRVRDAPEEPEP